MKTEQAKLFDDNLNNAQTVSAVDAIVSYTEKVETSMDVHWSSKSVEWYTPFDAFNALDAKYNFTLDPCCTEENAKCEKYYTKDDNGLIQSWEGERVFMNPPYGREISEWIKKAYHEARKGALVVCLIPSRTDTIWWHKYCMRGKIIFIKGRLKFGGASESAPFPSAIVVFGEGS